MTSLKTKPRKFSLMTVRVAQDIESHLIPSASRLLYATLRRAVYGTPADVEAEELLHCLAEMREEPDPSEPVTGREK